MRLKASLLNSDLTLNNFKHLSVIKVERGETLDLVIQLMDADRGIRYIPEAGATVEIQIPRSVSVLADANSQRTYADNSIVRPAVTPFAEDRSIWKIPLAESDTSKLVSTSIRVVVTEASGKKICVLNQAIQVLTPGT